MSAKKKVTIFKVVLTVLVVAIIIGVLAYLFPLMKNLSTMEGQVAFKEKVNSSGFLGLLSLFGLEVAQIFLFIVPGEPIEVLAGMCYGGFWGTIFILASACIISVIIFFLVRKFGKKFVLEFCSEKKIEKIENSKLFQNPKKIELILFMLFFIPGTPKDLLVYVSGLLPIRTSRFIIITTIARIPSVISSTLAGENIAVGNWKLGIIMYAVVFAIVAIIAFIINKLDKDKVTKEAINTIK